MKSHFPKDDYTPHGYIDNPFHSAIENPSGVFRTVPPLGMGYWCRNLPFPYGNGFGLLRRLNYLSFVMPSMRVGDVSLCTEEDFCAAGITVTSHWHTKNVLSYDFAYGGVDVSVQYCLGEEDALIGCVHLCAREDVKVEWGVGHLYGYPEQRYWGCDGYTGRYIPAKDKVVAKGFAYGDVFSLGADVLSTAQTVQASEAAWMAFRRAEAGNELPEASAIAPSPIYAALRYDVPLTAGEARRFHFCLARDKNEAWSVDRCDRNLGQAAAFMKQRLEEDEIFYAGMPCLSGDWPDVWRRGWIYHFETVRMTIRPPRGIYKHPWDSMQIHTPRQVLGETAIDCMLLSYADIGLAKEVILGTFMDAIAPHVPCTREDGSMNMISQEGEECATSPIWVLLFPTIRSIYLRSGDEQWLRQLFPFLKEYIAWWLSHRADSEGWLHVACSWEAQDGSKRFNITYDDETTCGADTSGVRTADLQAAVADGVRDMAGYAGRLGFSDDEEHYRELFSKMDAQTQSMYVDGRFRDVDGATQKPIIIDDYFDIMMLTPYAVRMAAPEQTRESRELFAHFVNNPRHWLEWPSFLYIYTEGARLSGWRDIAANVTAHAALREYPRLDMRSLRDPMVENDLNLPAQFFYRVPGVGNEFWAISEDNPGGCENYGWGSTLPMLIIRNIIGFTEGCDGQFHIAPYLPDCLWQEGKTYAITNLTYRGGHFGLALTCGERAKRAIRVSLTCPQGWKATLEEEGDSAPVVWSQGQFQAVVGSTGKIVVTV